jgi:oxaloacetate decarboxylase alpha subunit
MVTPLSQFVATQATMNVVSGERYKVIPDGIIEYVAGYHGAPPAPVNQDVMDKIYRLPKAKTILEQEFPQPSVAEIRQQMGIGPKVSDEEFLLRYALGEDEVNAMLAADPD